MLRLLCITAHPDDESAAFGGSLLLYRERGVESHVLCLTPGQAARHRGNARSDDELAEVRRREFKAACEILEVSHGEVLDYPDGRLELQDFYKVVGRLTDHIRRIRPQVVLTFGTEGAVTAHPDHSMASIFATMAYHWAGRSNRYTEQLARGLNPHRAQKLYYDTSSYTLPDRPPVAPAPVTTIINISAYRERKITAFRAHQTQAPLFPIFEDIVRRAGEYERFHLAASLRPGIVQQENDLFDGVTEE